MSERIDTPLTNEHFAAFCLSMLGQPYWYGTALHKCSEGLRASKARQYPSHYGSSRTSRYRQDIANKKVCADCMGGAKGYAWTNGGQGVLEAIGTDKTFEKKSGSNGCPDKSSNSMFSWAKSKGMDWGTIDTLPDIVGLAVRFDGHVGYTVGGGYAVEWRGFAYGCVKDEDQGARLDALVQAAVHRLQRRRVFGAGEGDRARLPPAQKGCGGQRRQSAAGSADETGL